MWYLCGVMDIMDIYGSFMVIYGHLWSYKYSEETPAV